jgi:putative tryptophan/tyrosine transport system substrate-binding protein
MHFRQWKRREFIALLLGGAAAWPLAAWAQQAERVRRVGLLMGFPEGDPDGLTSAAVFLRGLQELGWIEGHNIRTDTRWAGADPGRARMFAKELVAMAPDVIVPSTNLVTAILQQETRTVPVVFVFVGDPVGSGFVATQARPGGNLTGFAIFEPAIGGKWLELLKEIAPQVSRVAVVLHPETPVNLGFLRAVEAAAPSLGVSVIMLGVHTAEEIEHAISEFAPGSAGGLIVAPHAVTQQHRGIITTLAARYRLPAIYGPRHFAKDGGLIAYGPNPIEPFRNGPSYVDRILRGAKPADLPVQFPTKYELVINLKSARALALEMPPTLLARADEVIE